MSALTDRIAAVLLEHTLQRTSDIGSRCKCGEPRIVQLPYTAENVQTHAAHVAEQIEAELGLTEEAAFRYTHKATGKFTIIETGSADVRIARKIAGDTHELTAVQRWVSAWSVVES